MSDKFETNRDEPIIDVAKQDPYLSPEEMARIRDEFKVKDAYPKSGIEVYDHFSAAELVRLNEVLLADNVDIADPENLRVFGKYIHLMEMAARVPGEGGPDSSDQEDWRRLQDALKKEGLLGNQGED